MNDMTIETFDLPLHGAANPSTEKQGTSAGLLRAGCGYRRAVYVYEPGYAGDAGGEREDGVGFFAGGLEGGDLSPWFYRGVEWS